MVVVNTIGFGLRIETGAERTTIVDIFDITQHVRDTGIHPKVDQESKRSEREADGRRTHVYLS